MATLKESAGVQKKFVPTPIVFSKDAEAKDVHAAAAAAAAVAPIVAASGGKRGQAANKRKFQESKTAK